MATVCERCGEKLVCTRDRGWGHMYLGKPGGGFMQHCRRCGWMGAPHPRAVPELRR
jgi:hypothetical protein